MSVRGEGLKYPCYWIYKDIKSQWRWVYYGDNGEEIGESSESYASKQNCQRSVNIMKASSHSIVSEPKSS